MSRSTHPEDEIDENSPRGFEIYLAFSPTDSEFVSSLAAALEQSGLNVRVDWESGRPIGKERQFREIEDSKTIGFIISPDSVTTGHWRRQLEIAARHRKPIIPIVLRHIAQPDRIPQPLRLHDAVFFTEDKQFDSALSTLLAMIHLHTKDSRRITTSTVAAPLKRTPKAKSSKRIWALFLTAIGVIGALATFWGSISALWTGKDSAKNFVQDEQRRSTKLDRIENYLRFGQLSEARFAATDFDNSSSNGRYVALLLECFDGPRKWDSKDEKGRTELLAELRGLSQTPLCTQAQILTQYRLKDKGESASKYFRAVEASLTAPYIRYLAAREAEDDTIWAVSILRSVSEDAKRQNVCQLDLQARVWLARIYRRSGNAAEVKVLLPVLDAEFPHCKMVMEQTPEVRLRGEQLLFTRASEHSDSPENALLAESVRSRLVYLSGRVIKDSSREAVAVSTNACYWIADDLLSRGLATDAELAISPVLPYVERDEFLRDDYSYVCAMLRVFSARARLDQGLVSQDVQSQLVSAATDFEAMRHDTTSAAFLPQKALCSYYLAELYLARGVRSLAQREFEVAEAIRSRCLTLSQIPFEYELVRSRMKEKLETLEQPGG